MARRGKAWSGKARITMINLQKYYQSTQWRQKRQERLKLDNHRCRFCDEDGTNYHLEIHHRPSSYAKIPNESVINDLITVCVFCHNIITERIRRRRYEGHKIQIQYKLSNAVERMDKDVESSKISVEIRMSVNPPQRRTGEPFEPVSFTDEEVFWEKDQDSRRP